MQLLHLDSSVLGSHSASRALSAEIVARQLALRPGMNVTRRDLAADAALHLSSAHLAAWQGGAVEDALLDADLAKGGAYLEELFAADIIVIGAPTSCGRVGDSTHRRSISGRWIARQHLNT
jgi:FMN-dependent NADH-azoreductase